MEKINIKTSARIEFVDITHKVRQLVEKSGIKEGICFLFCPHTTAGLTINENADPSVKRDILLALRHMVPDNLPYAHSEGNSPAHVKASLCGSSLLVIIKEGKLRLGTWQGITFCEFDGPRRRRIYVSSL